MGLGMRGARVQGCAMQAYRARDVRMWGWGSRLQAEETGMWEYRGWECRNTEIQGWECGLQESRMQGYRAQNVGVRGWGCRDRKVLF